MNTKDFAIGVLTVTGVILLAALIVVHALTPREAKAFGQSSEGGDYLVTTAQYSDYVELLVVFDTAQMKMNAYMFNNATNQVDLLQPPIPIVRQQPQEKTRTPTRR
jgi:hypothetical protein